MPDGLWEGGDRPIPHPMGPLMDDHSFTRIYDDHVWDVYGFIGYRVSSRADAEDLTQLTFERALRAWGRFDSRRASARTWLLAIARNLVVDHYRQESSDAGRREPRPELNGEAVPVLDRPSLGVSAELEAALATLGDRERELIALRYGGELSGPEIAELTGLTLANVQQILSRSLRRLRGELEGESVAELVG